MTFPLDPFAPDVPVDPKLLNENLKLITTAISHIDEGLRAIGGEIAEMREEIAKLRAAVPTGAGNPTPD